MLYIVKIFSSETDSSEGEYCGEFAIMSTEIVTTRFVRQFKQVPDDGYVICPIDSPLQACETYRFEVYSPHREFAAIISDGSFTQLVREEDGKFSISYRIPVTVKQFSIGVTNERYASYNTIAVYEVSEIQ